MTNNNLFKSAEKETEQKNLNIVGTIPNWLNGSFLRNGPAKFETDKQQMKHWFDGYALLHRFNIENGKVSYQNKFLQSEDFQSDIKSGKVKSAQWGTVADPCASIFNKFFGAFQSINPDNSNVNIMKVGKRSFAISDFSTLVEFDAESLETKGRIQFADKLGKKFMLSSAHPSFDPFSGEIFNALCEIGPKGKVHLYKFAEGKTERQIFASFAIDKPVYYHSFALSKDYFIFVEQPLQLNALTLLFARLRNEPFESHFKWNKNLPNTYHIYHRKTGKLQSIKGPSFFFFHSANCFQSDENTIHIDLCQYSDFEISKLLYLDSIATNGIPGVKVSRLHRISIDTQKETIENKQLSDRAIELPQFNKNYSMQPYRYVYGLGAHDNEGKNDFLNQLEKIDLKDGSSISWYEKGCYPSEPIFVPAPNAKAEDEGLLLSMVLDANKNCSKLMVFDAQSFAVLAVAETETLIPPGLHGNFYSRK